MTPIAAIVRLGEVSSGLQVRYWCDADTHLAAVITLAAAAAAWRTYPEVLERCLTRLLSGAAGVGMSGSRLIRGPSTRQVVGSEGSRRAAQT